MKCKCGFEFSGPGELRNCSSILIAEAGWVNVCPECRTYYRDSGTKVEMKEKSDADV